MAGADRGPHPVVPSPTTATPASFAQEAGDVRGSHPLASPAALPSGIPLPPPTALHLQRILGNQQVTAVIRAQTAHPAPPSTLIQCMKISLDGKDAFEITADMDTLTIKKILNGYKDNQPALTAILEQLTKTTESTGNEPYARDYAQGLLAKLAPPSAPKGSMERGRDRRGEKEPRESDRRGEKEPRERDRRGEKEGRALPATSHGPRASNLKLEMDTSETIGPPEVKPPQSGEQIELHNHLSGVLSGEALLTLWKNQTGKKTLADLNDKSKLPTTLPSNEASLLEQGGEGWVDAYGLRQVMIDEITKGIYVAQKSGLQAQKEQKQRGADGAARFMTQVAEVLAAQKIVYAELQGNLPALLDRQLWKAIQEKYGVQIAFLKSISTTALTHAQGKETVSKAITAMGPEHTGVDFMGPEATFTREGMQALTLAYQELQRISQEVGRPMVLRPHVGEGNVQTKDAEAMVQAAAQNLDLVIGTLAILMQPTANASDQQVGQVLVRLGHATHASVDQLAKLATLGVTVEANMGSNVHTHAVSGPDAAAQMLLKMLYTGVPTVLSTDGGGVMGTTLPQEWARAEAIITDFTSGKTVLTLPDRAIAFADISEPQIQERFSMKWLRQQGMAYMSALQKR